MNSHAATEAEILSALEDSRETMAESTRAINYLRDALIKCAEISGEDMSGGVPTYPNVAIWAVGCVTQLRSDYDEALKELNRVGG